MKGQPGKEGRKEGWKKSDPCMRKVKGKEILQGEESDDDETGEPEREEKVYRSRTEPVR